MRIAARLLDNTPSRRRALAESALVYFSLFAPATAVLFGRGPLIAVTCGLAVWGLLLLHPWTDWRSGQRGRAAGCALLFALSLTGLTSIEWFGESLAPSPRLGALPKNVPLEGEGSSGRMVAEITRVLPGLPAAGKLEVGDRVLAVDGEPLSSSDPFLDFQQRIRNAGGRAETDMRFTLERQGARREVTVHVGPTRKAGRFKGGAVLWLCVRALGAILLVALLLWRDGQGPAQLGLVREGLGRELLLGLPVTLGAYAANLAASIPLSLIGKHLKLLGQESVARKELLSTLVGTGLSVPAFFVAMLLVTGFEEIAFRGFLIPRLRVLVGHWPAAVLLSAALFGLGHVYEGTLAIFQTAVLGLFFGFVFLYRFRLPSVMVAHALYNTITFAVAMWLLRSGLLEKALGQP